jgi:hypothetical protein
LQLFSGEISAAAIDIKADIRADIKADIKADLYRCTAFLRAVQRFFAWNVPLTCRFFYIMCLFYQL